MKSRLNLFVFILCLLATACDDLLEEEQFSELSEEAAQEILSRDALAFAQNSLINAYSSNRIVQNNFVAFLHAPSLMTGEVDGAGGAWNNSVSNPFENYAWTTDHFMLSNTYNGRYGVITECNFVNQLLSASTDTASAPILGQALGLRGYAYYFLYDFFGQVIISESIPGGFIENQPRASIDSVKQQIISDLSRAGELLETRTAAVGTMTKGAALGLLTKFYLNDKNWEMAAQTAEEVIDLGLYSLDPDYGSIFKTTSEGSQEIIWGINYQVNQNNEGHIFNALTLPLNILAEGNQTILPARMEVPATFVESFPAGDIRRNEFLLEYETNNGGFATLNNGAYVPYKYGQDPMANGNVGGTDYIALRYADILLSRAEALNEINGPNAESIDLINQVRSRANAPLVQQSDFASTSDLRDAILDERAWEFHLEGLRRQDLIRHGKLISDAQMREKAAQDFHVLFPIPQSEIDNNNNPGMFQNPGY